MAVQILSQSYGPRKPLIECTADSLDDLVGLVCAEGSTATVGGTEYVLDRVNGWIEPGSGGGGGGSGVLLVTLTRVEDAQEGEPEFLSSHTSEQIFEAYSSGKIVVARSELCGDVLLYAYSLGGSEYEVYGSTPSADGTTGVIYRVYIYGNGASIDSYSFTVRS